MTADPPSVNGRTDDRTCQTPMYVFGKNRPNAQPWRRVHARANAPGRSGRAREPFEASRPSSVANLVERTQGFRSCDSPFESAKRGSVDSSSSHPGHQVVKNFYFGWPPRWPRRWQELDATTLGGRTSRVVRSRTRQRSSGRYEHCQGESYGPYRHHAQRPWRGVEQAREPERGGQPQMSAREDRLWWEDPSAPPATRPTRLCWIGVYRGAGARTVQTVPRQGTQTMAGLMRPRDAYVAQGDRPGHHGGAKTESAPTSVRTRAARRCLEIERETPFAPLKASKKSCRTDATGRDKRLHHHASGVLELRRQPQVRRYSVRTASAILHRPQRSVPGQSGGGACQPRPRRADLADCVAGLASWCGDTRRADWGYEKVTFPVTIAAGGSRLRARQLDAQRPRIDEIDRSRPSRSGPLPSLQGQLLQDAQTARRHHPDPTSDGIGARPTTPTRTSPSSRRLRSSTTNWCPGSSARRVRAERVWEQCAGTSTAPPRW